MLVHLSDIVSQEGKVVQKEVEVTLESISSQLGKFKIAEKTPVQLVITNTGEKVLELEGKGSVTVEIPCDRCLERVSVPFELMFKRKVDMKQSEEDRIKDLDESNYITGLDLDVDMLVYDEILINWPLKVLCKEDCKGICSQCGQNLNHGTCDCDQTSLDPRMAAISDIFSKFKEV